MGEKRDEDGEIVRGKAGVERNVVIWGMNRTKEANGSRTSNLKRKEEELNLLETAGALGKEKISRGGDD